MKTLVNYCQDVDYFLVTRKNIGTNCNIKTHLEKHNVY